MRITLRCFDITYMYINKHCYHYTAYHFTVISIFKMLVNALLQVFIILHILPIISIKVTPQL